MRVTIAVFVCVVLSFVCVIAEAPLTSFNCGTPPATPEDRRSNRAVLRVGTFNAYWLFSGQPSDPSSSPWKGDVNKAEHHLTLVADEIRQTDADILVLQEIQDCSILQSLVSFPGYMTIAFTWSPEQILQLARTWVS